MAHPTPLSTSMAPVGQFRWQAPHSMHASPRATRAVAPSMANTPCGHTIAHRPQPPQRRHRRVRARQPARVHVQQDERLGAEIGEVPLMTSSWGLTETAPAAMGAPSGGVTIAEVWQRKAELAGSQVTVQGRVVKYNAAILGRNWLHLQDGSGELEQGTNDITVTTTDEVAVGDVVTVTGTVAVDRDFGAGYTYTVMLEDASIGSRQ